MRVLPFLALFLLALPARADGPCLGDRKIVAYYIEWGIYGRNYQPADTPLDKITHLNYAFANIGPDLKIQVGDAYAAIDKYYPGDTWNQPFRGTYNQFNNVLRALHPHIKTLISVGGWTWSGRFSDVALTSQSRQTFAASCVAFIRQYHFDGVDLDWEYPVCCGLASNTYRPQDKQNFTLLLQEMRQQLDAAGTADGRRYLLTIAAPAGYDKMANIEMDQIAQHLDWINVMCYDFFGAWDLSSTGHHAGFNANPAAPFSPPLRDRYNTSWAMNAYLAAGVPSRKLTIGVPFYGHAWGGVSATNSGLFRPGTFIPPGTWDDWQSGATGVNDYTQIQQFLASGGYQRFWDPIALAPYAYHPTQHTGHFISYEDPESLGNKLSHINQSNLGGVMCWEVTADRNQTLLNTILSGLHTTCYANCDCSTTAPILNVNDFSCFLNKFAASDPAANCDASTTLPILNINDFQCFMNKFAAGCP